MSPSDWVNGTATAPTINNYIGSKLNYTKQCAAGDGTSAGCLPITLVSGQVSTSSVRWILPNGAVAYNYSGGWGLGFEPNSMTWVVVADTAYKNPTSRQSILFTCNPTSSNPTVAPGSSWGIANIKPGACGALASFPNALNDGLGLT